MSSTQSETSTIAMPHEVKPAPELTIVSRVASIPLISSSLSVLDNTFSQNAYLASPYTTAKGLSMSAFKYTEPIQSLNVIAPLLVKADGLANTALDVVEKRYPYPFHAKPEEVADFVKERRESIGGSVQGYVRMRKESVESGVKGIDQRFTPLVDYYEQAITRGSGSTPHHPEGEYQYQRALSLSKNLANNLSVYSAEQIKQIQAHNVLIQRTQETATSLQNLASTSYSRIHSLSDNMLVQLQKLQASTSHLSASLTNSANSHAQQLQDNLTGLSKSFGETVNGLHGILIQKDVSVQEKVGLVGKEVGERVQPLLDSVKEVVEGMVKGSHKVQTTVTE